MIPGNELHFLHIFYSLKRQKQTNKKKKTSKKLFTIEKKKSTCRKPLHYLSQMIDR